MKKDPSSAVHTENRRLAAIMFTDIVGFSRQMGTDEARMLRLLEIHNQLIQQAVSVHHGTVVKTVGDAFLVDFPSVVNALQSAQAIQAQLRAHNAEKEKDEPVGWAKAQRCPTKAALGFAGSAQPTYLEQKGPAFL